MKSILFSLVLVVSSSAFAYALRIQDTVADALNADFHIKLTGDEIASRLSQNVDGTYNYMISKSCNVVIAVLPNPNDGGGPDQIGKVVAKHSLIGINGCK